MNENQKCRCPLCNQRFMPEEGLSLEEHLAKGIIKAYREMQDLPHTYELPGTHGEQARFEICGRFNREFQRRPACPRCGHMQMKRELSENTVS